MLAAIGFILFWSGLFLSVAGNLMFLAVVFRYSATWFFGCLFVPLVDVAYFVLNAKQTWKPMALSVAGLLMNGIGSWIGGFYPLS